MVTGGAGFIGSHLIDVLLARDMHVTVFDNLSTGRLQNIENWLAHGNFTFIKGDLLNPADIKKLEMNQYEVVFHLAANPEVRVGSTNPHTHFQQNVMATEILLEHLRATKSVLTVLFSSTSTVYGEPTKIPTKEDFAPLKPISIYGASKLACEALIAAYAHTYSFRATIYRLANVVGPRSEHGVAYDFVQKLRKKPNELEILGDGTQNKSYIYVSDCIDAMLLGLEKSREQVGIYNVGSEDQIDVTEIASIVTQEMGLKSVQLRFTGGVDGGRGWRGDVKSMLLDINRIKVLGWRPRFTSKRALKKTVTALIQSQSPSNNE